MSRFLWLPSWCVLFGSLLTPALTRAQGPQGSGAADPVALWGEMSLPGGGPALLESATVQGPADEWRTLPLLIELAFGAPDGLRFSRNIQSYAATLQRFHRHVAAISSDGVLSLTMPAAEKRRGEFEALLETIGLSIDRGRRQVKLRTGADDVARVATLKKAGVHLEGMAERLNAGESVVIQTKDTVVPLPLGQAFWSSRLDAAHSPRDLVWAILSSREMSSLYYGLLSLDEATLTAVQADPKLASSLARRAAALPIAAPALRIADGRIVPAGGPLAGALWENLVDQPVSKPADFVDELLAADDGRLAYFYSIVAALPEGPLTFLTGGPQLAANARLERFRRLYGVFRDALGEWRPDSLTPVPTRGPANVLHEIAANRDGVMAGPPWRDFWASALESSDWPADPARTLGKFDTTRLMEPADVLLAICPDVCREDRLGVFTLIQREFPEPVLMDAPLLLTVARTRLRYPALALTIERMHLADATAYSALGSFASTLERLAQPRQALAVVQFQAAVSFLARLRITGVSAGAIIGHINALTSLPTNGGFKGGLVRWLATTIAAPTPGEDLDEATIRALSGPAADRESPVIEWEGVSYRLDPAVTESARVRAARSRFTANSLASAQELLIIADGVREAVKTDRLAELMKSLDAVAMQITDVDSLLWTGESFTAAALGELPRKTAESLRRVRATDQRRIDRSVETILSAVDVVAADALVSLVYALAIEDPENPLALSSTLPRRHQLYVGGSLATKATSPWMIPLERTVEGKSRHAAGSLVALDLGVPSLTARRMGSTRPEHEPNMSGQLAERLLRTAAMAKIWQMSDTEQQELMATRQRGNAEIERWQASRRAGRPLADAGIAGPRAGWIAWTLARGTFDAKVLVRGEDLARLGGLAARVGAGAGVALEPSLCLCMSMPAVSWERRGQPREAVAAATGLVEPMLRVMHELTERRLPVGLAPGLLAIFTTDLIEQSWLPHPADIHAILAAVRSTPSVRFDDYIAALAARGPLVRAAASPEGLLR